MPTTPRRRCDDCSIIPTTPGRSVPEDGRRSRPAIGERGGAWSRSGSVSSPASRSGHELRCDRGLGSSLGDGRRDGRSGATQWRTSATGAARRRSSPTPRTTRTWSLARALRPDRRRGFWIDVGAGHPVWDSTSPRRSRTGDGAGSTSSRCRPRPRRCARSDPTTSTCRWPSAPLRDGQALRGPARQPGRVDDGPRARRPLQPGRPGVHAHRGRGHDAGGHRRRARDGPRNRCGRLPEGRRRGHGGRGPRRGRLVELPPAHRGRGSHDPELRPSPPTRRGSPCCCRPATASPSSTG